jgi:hypothetical protein
VRDKKHETERYAFTNGQIARLSQILITVIVSRMNPNHLLINVILAAIVHAGAAQAACTMFNFKIASVVDADPVWQLVGHAIGTIAGALTSALFVKIYTGTYVVPGARFAAPAALEWMSTAKSVYADGLPPFCLPFSIAFATVFALLAVVRIKFANSPGHRFIPGGVAFAIGEFLHHPGRCFALTLSRNVHHPGLHFAALPWSNRVLVCQKSTGRQPEDCAVHGIGIESGRKLVWAAWSCDAFIDSLLLTASQKVLDFRSWLHQSEENFANNGAMYSK